MGCKNKDNYTPRIKMRGPVFAPISSFPQWGHLGHIDCHFRDLFSVQFSRKTFRKMGSKCPMCPQPVLHITIHPIKHPGTLPPYPRRTGPGSDARSDVTNRQLHFSPPCSRISNLSTSLNRIVKQERTILRERIISKGI